MAKSKASKRRYAVVCGAFSFPHDMLRYDCCFPVLETHSHLFTDKGKRAILVTTEHVFTEKRWASFGWSLKEFTDRWEAENEADRLNAMFEEQADATT